MIKKFLIAASLMFSTAVQAEGDAHNSLGFAAGGTYGVGLSYSYDTPVWGIQVTGLPFWDDGEGRVFGGVNVKRNFHENGKVGLYGSAGVAGGIWREEHEECNWSEQTEEDECETVVEEGWGVVSGPGVGMQMLFWDNMLFRFELPLGIKVSSEGFGVLPIPNGALMYRW